MGIFSSITDWFDNLHDELVYQRGYDAGEKQAQADDDNETFEDGFHDGYYSNKD